MKTTKTIIISAIAWLFLVGVSHATHATECQIGVILNGDETKVAIKCDKEDCLLLKQCSRDIIRIQDKKQEVVVCCDSSGFCVGIYLPTDKEDL